MSAEANRYWIGRGSINTCLTSCAGKECVICYENCTAEFAKSATIGKPRTGKSTLLVSMALSDIEKGYSTLFIDPHIDAITDLVARIPKEKRDIIILVDPTDKCRSFGINVLYCADPTNGIEIDHTYGRVLDFFAKVGEDDKANLGFWLDKVLRNSVYLLGENNPGYTLVEAPLH